MQGAAVIFLVEEEGSEPDVGHFFLIERDSLRRREVSAPEDREPVVRKLIEGAGGKLVNFYFTTGDTDFIVVSEANEGESIIAAMLAAVAEGSIFEVKTVRAWTGAEFKAIAEKASKAASHYRAPGKS